MEKLKELMSKCKCSVSITINNHKDFYQTASEYIEELILFDTEVDKSIIDKIIDLDTIVEVHAYPNTPIGFFKVIHYDLDLAMDLMIEVVNNN